MVPKNCLKSDIDASASFAEPDTRLLYVISSSAVVIAKPGIKMIMADKIVRGIFQHGQPESTI